MTLRFKHWWEGKWKQHCPEKDDKVQQGVGGGGWDGEALSSIIHTLVMKKELEQKFYSGPHRLPSILCLRPPY